MNDIFAINYSSRVHKLASCRVEILDSDRISTNSYSGETSNIHLSLAPRSNLQQNRLVLYAQELIDMVTKERSQYHSTIQVLSIQKPK